jgi:dolichol kinase
MMLNLVSIQLPLGIMLFGALVATWVELLPLPMNDNLMIPLVSGGVMELMIRMAVSV